MAPTASTDQSPDRLSPDQALLAGAAALVLGVLAAFLFNGAALGVNVPLWVGLLVLTHVVVGRRCGRPVDRLASALLAVSFGLSVMVAWRAAAAIQLALLGACLILLLLALAMPDGLRERRVSISAFALSLLMAIGAVVRGAVLILGSIAWREVAGARGGANARTVARVAALAVPLLIVFGGLFIAADAVFRDRAAELLNVDVAAARRHLAWTLGGAAVAAGVLWLGLGPREPIPAGPRLPERRRLRAVETGIVLGALAALFASFVAVQVRYLFGGGDVVLASTGLTYAEYARRGFFELVAVAVLLLPVLFAADWARVRSGRSLTTYRVFATLLVLLLLVVMASAFQRLRIYIDVFGLTALRFYASAMLGWLALVFAWLLWSVLRQRRNEFAVGAVSTAVVVLVAVVAVNPHALIASTNLARAEDGRDFDVAHALRLSADATPTILGSLDALEGEDACEVASTLVARWDGHEDGWRSWNWGRSAATEAVESQPGDLEGACG